MTGFIHRSVPAELDVKSDGRTVEAYAAVFDVPAEIRDNEGHYLETIDRAAFTRAINRAKPQGGRDHWLTSVFYNHGKTLYGTPSDTYSLPIARTKHIEADERGVLTVSEYANTDLGEHVLSLIRDGIIRAQSFTGKIVRSTPELPRGQFYRPDRGGQLKTVRRLELGLSEYGPTPVPCYDEAEVVGVRAALLNGSAGINDADLVRALRLLLAAAPGDVLAPEDEDIPQDPAAGGADAPDASLAADGSPSEVEERPTQLPLSRRLEVAMRARGMTP